MSVPIQIAIGSGLLILCAVTHIAVSAQLVKSLKSRKSLRHQSGQAALIRLVSLIFTVFVLSHTLHVHIWAIAVWLLGALPGYEQPIYFALVTYTTLGYGDVTLAPDFRILGAMGSVPGILMFGLTTAFLVSVFTRALGVERA